MGNILVIDDEESIRTLIHDSLMADHLVTTCGSIQEAKKIILQKKFHLVILDVNLPDGNGFEFFSTLKNSRHEFSTPLFFVTGNSGIPDQVLAFSLGADDYLIKPIHPILIRAKVNARIKRQEELNKNSDVNIVGNIKLVLSQYKVFLLNQDQEKEINVTPIEFKFLALFAKNEGRVFSRDQILNSIWGDQISITDRTIDCNLSRIRAKLKQSTHTIKSVHKIGYKLVSRN